MSEKKLSFNIDLLQLNIQQHNAELVNYPDKLTRESVIDFKCKCGKSFTKRFIYIVKKGGAYCNECTKFNTKNKKVSTFLDKYGTSNPMQNELVKQKTRNTVIEKYGTTNLMLNTEIKQKISQTNLEKYGVANVFSSPTIQAKIKNTNLEKYGNECHLKSQIIRDNIKKSIQQKYGVDISTKHPNVISKMKETNLKLYGSECSLHNVTIQNKSKTTILQKYGVEHPMQSNEIHEKSQKNSKKFKSYTMPSGEVRKIQGYENFALDELLLEYSENEIKTNRKDVPRIKYTLNEKAHYYFPDIYIPKNNTLIEVKSKYTYDINKEKNLEKANQCKNDGYDYKVWVYDVNGNKLINYT